MIAGGHKTNDFSMAIHEHWIPPVWIHNDNPLFTGNPELANVRGQNKWLFNGNPGQVKPSCCPLHGKARLRCTEVYCTAQCTVCYAQEYGAFQQLWQWQCIGNALGTLGENGCGSRAARTAHPPSSTQRIELQWLQHTFGHQRERNNCAFHSPVLLRIDWCTFHHFKPSGQLTQGLREVTNSSWDVISSKTWQVWICGEAWMHESQSECHSIQSWDQN